jgi:hypothetical protein
VDAWSLLVMVDADEGSAFCVFTVPRIGLLGIGIADRIGMSQWLREWELLGFFEFDDSLLQIEVAIED